MPYNNIIFHLIFIKPFYKINKLIEIKTLKLKYNNKDIYKDIIVINIINNAVFTPPLKRNKGRLYKNLNITFFL